MPISFSLRLNTVLLILLVLMGAAIIAMLAVRAEGGPLDPPAPPAATMKTLQEIEPRTPISSVPYVITTPGSYYLTQNLTVSTLANGITINASNVVLDLNGFTIDGGNVGFRGIYVSSGPGVTIRNGTVTRFTDWGVDAQHGSLVENVHSNSNSIGFVVNGTLRGCSAISNTSVGVWANYSTVDGCYAESNPTGFSLEASTLSHCSVMNNFNGISLQASIVDGCVVRGGTIGITVNGSTKVESGSVVRNNSVQGTAAHGIYVPGWNSYIEGNTVVDTGKTESGNGIYVTGQRNRIDSNHVNDGLSGIVVGIGTGNVVVRNSSDANFFSNYSFGPENDAAPVQQAGTSTNPWANLAH